MAQHHRMTVDACVTDDGHAFLSGVVFAKESTGVEIVGNGTTPHPLAVRLTPVQAAAPELLAALEATLDDVESMACDFSAHMMLVENPDHPWHETVMRLRAAIAKAKGE